MQYNVGAILRVDGELYQVIGKIQYRNINDNCRWMEYRLKKVADGSEVWLSADETYNEYALSHTVRNADLNGYKKVDEGIEEVVAAHGRVDVSVGDRASFTEYEDASEENIISEEVWDDGREVSVGYYLDWDEVALEPNRQENGVVERHAGGEKKKMPSIIKAIIIIFAVFLGLGFIRRLIGTSHEISDYLKDNTSAYVYVTSITGNGREKADVYWAASGSINMTSMAIIEAVDGNVTDVQQNNEDGDDSVAILTDDEYCLVYTSEDDEVLVQVSSREYVYSSDKRPYRCHAGTHRYYRRFYYTRGYYRDISDFGTGKSAYTDYDDGTVDYDSTNTYNTYSSSIRQSSVGGRTSSGGGLSSGK